MAGLLGIVSDRDCSKLLRRGLTWLRHRGDDFFGITGENGGVYDPVYQAGEYSRDEFFNPTFRQIVGNVLIGAVSAHPKEQPIKSKYHGADLALVVDGKILNADELSDGSGDALIAKYLISQKKDILEGINYKRSKITGTQNSIILWNQTLFAERTPNGVLPLQIGKGENGYAVGSNDYVLRKLGFNDVISIRPGEIYKITLDGYEKLQGLSDEKHETCAFLWTYTEHLDSKLKELYAAQLRERLGRKLFENDTYIKELIESGKVAKEDIVVSPILESGRGAAAGYYWQMVDEGYRAYPADVFIPSRRYKRSYIPVNENERKKAATLKLDEIRYYVENKYIILVDDSLVRGTQTLARVGMLQDHNPLGIAARFSHPRIYNPCKFHLSTRRESELIANRHQDDQAIAATIGANNVEFNSYNDYRAAFEGIADGLCMYCAQPPKK